MSTPPVPPPPNQVTHTTAARDYISKNRALLAIIAGLVVVVLGLAGAWVAQNEVTRNEAAKVLDLRETRDGLQDELSVAQDRLAEVSSENEDRKSREADLAAAEAAVAQRENEVGTREAAVTATEEQVAANTITEGVWTVGVDIEAGTYRTKEAPTDCYWAIYTSGTNQDDIIQNDIVTGGMPTVTLREGQDFETNRCGSWVKQ